MIQKQKSIFRAGWTLTELLVILLIAGVLAAIATPTLLSWTRYQTLYLQAIAALEHYEEAVYLYQLQNNGDFPPDALSNQAPPGINPPSELPPGIIDYNHWGVGNNQCAVFVEWFGVRRRGIGRGRLEPNRERNYPLYTLPLTNDRGRRGDMLIRILGTYPCNSGRRAIGR